MHFVPGGTARVLEYTIVDTGVSTHSRDANPHKVRACVQTHCVHIGRGVGNVAAQIPSPRGGRKWCQSVTSLFHMLSGSHVALPDVASARGVICSHGVREPPADLALPPDASAGDAVRPPPGAIEEVASECGVTCSQPRVAAGRGVRSRRPSWVRRTWPQGPGASRHVSLQCDFSRWPILCAPPRAISLYSYVPVVHRLSNVEGSIMCLVFRSPSESG